MDGTRSLVSNGEIYIYGVVDPMSFGDPEFVRAIDVIASLLELGDRNPVTVHLNSPGGAIFEGLAIYDALKASGKRIIVRIDAMAASIASIIAMAGDEIVIAESAMVMIHNPLAVAAGESDDFRKMAEDLDRIKNRLVDIYVARTGQTAEQIQALMDKETYFYGAEAVEAGFADRTDEPLLMAACGSFDSKTSTLARLLVAPSTIRAQRPMPAATAAQPEERLMSHESATAAAGTSAAAIVQPSPVVEVPANVGATGQAALPDMASVRAEAVRSERDRVSGIYASARAAKVDIGFAEQLVRDNVHLTDARAQIINKWSEAQEHAEGGGAVVETRNQIRIETDGVDRWVKGATKGLMARANMKDGERNEFTGLTMVELARSALNARNVKNGHLGRMEMVGLAFTARNSGPGYHSTSDFGSVLASVAYRSMMVGYEEVDENFDQWTSRGTASDFRPISRVDMGLFPALEKVEEGAEYKYGTIGDTGTTVQIATYGKMFAITRQAIINDDLGFFDRVPRRMGRAAKRTIGNLVYAILNGNPTMQDGVALFHASHGNLAGSAAAISVPSLGVAMAAMAVQKDEAGIGTSIGVVPKFLLLPPTLLMTANTVLTSATIPGDAGQVANPVRGLVTPIQDSRLSGTAWYLAGAPGQVDTIEVTYLDGVTEPFMDQREGWNVDGSEFKVRMDAGVKALHWRGLFKNAGA